LNALFAIAHWDAKKARAPYVKRYVSSSADGKENKRLTQHSLYRHLDSVAAQRQSAYRQLFRSAIGKADLKALREATNKGWVLGEGRFRERIEQLSDRRTTPKLRGRPKKVGEDKK